MGGVITGCGVISRLHRTTSVAVDPIQSDATRTHHPSKSPQIANLGYWSCQLQSPVLSPLLASSLLEAGRILSVRGSRLGFVPQNISVANAAVTAVDEAAAGGGGRGSGSVGQGVQGEF